MNMALQREHSTRLSLQKTTSEMQQEIIELQEDIKYYDNIVQQLSWEVR